MPVRLIFYDHHESFQYLIVLPFQPNVTNLARLFYPQLSLIPSLSPFLSTDSDFKMLHSFTRLSIHLLPLWGGGVEASALCGNYYASSLLMLSSWQLSSGVELLLEEAFGVTSVKFT